MSVPLVLSIAALALGPLIYARTRSGRAAAAVDAFAIVGVGGLVIFHILPQSFEIAGWAVIPLALVGLFGPGFLCGSRFLHGESAGKITMPLAVAGIAVHAVLDGVALWSGDTANGEADASGRFLAVAVVLHRLPVGLGIWWLARPTYGARVSLGLLAAIGLFSVVGFAFGDTIVAAASVEWVALLQAVVAGSLLHVILKHPPTIGAAARPVRFARLASGLGGLAGLGLVLGLEAFHLEADQGHAAGARETFLDLSLQSAPALLFAYMAVAIVHAVGLDLKRIFGSGGVLSQTLRGTFAGLPIPICSCGVIPIYRGLVQQRVPAPAAMSFLVATPELGFAAIFLSWQLLGGEITLARAASAAVLAFAVGWLVGRNARTIEPLPTPATTEGAPLSARARVARGLRYGFGDMVDGTAPWILVGLAIAAALEPLVQAEELAALPAWAEVPLFALVGMPVYVCASGSTPLVAVLIAKGVSPGAAIAFLLTGPATNLTTFGVLARLHGRQVALGFGAVAMLVTVLLGFGVNGLFDATGTVAVPHVRDHAVGLLGWLCLVALAAVFAVSLLRQGTRAFVGQVISPHHDDRPHDHDGHAHGEHEHGAEPHAGAAAPARSCCAHEPSGAAHT